MNIKIYPTKLFKALSNSKRLKILLFLSECPQASVSDISAELNIPFLTASRNLLKLKAAGFITGKRKSRYILYKCSDSKITQRFIEFIKKNLKE